MADSPLAPVDRVDRLTEAVYTLAAVELASRERLSADQAAKRIAQQNGMRSGTPWRTGDHLETVIARST